MGAKRCCAPYPPYTQSLEYVKDEYTAEVGSSFYTSVFSPLSNTKVNITATASTTTAITTASATIATTNAMTPGSY